MRSKLVWTVVIVAMAAGAMMVVLLPPHHIWGLVQQVWRLLDDRDRVEAFVRSFGIAAPLVFVLIQILQVVLAPIPGEATGLVGGYLFGAGAGFCYSTLALTIGSLLNFFLARFLGRRFVRRLVAEDKLRRFDNLLKRQGALVTFALFVLPGFPKDYLCLFLGLSNMSVRLFLLLAFIGRMPGTFLLSLQGGALFNKNYSLFLLVFLFCVIAMVILYALRNTIYGWIEKIDNAGEQAVDRRSD